MKIGIIGIGHVGADVAYTLSREKLATELVLIDLLAKKSEAERLELEDSMIVWDHSVNIITQKYEALNDADIVVISVGSQNLEVEDRNSELKDNVASLNEAIPKILASGFNGLFIVISNPCDVITRKVQELSGFEKHRVIGTGTLLDSSRMKRVLGDHFNVSPLDISGYVLGEHGETQFIPWSTIRVEDKLISDSNLLSKEQMESLKEATRLGGWDIFNGKGWTSYGIAAMCARLVQAIKYDEKRVYPVSVYDPEYNLYLGYPAKIGKDGIISRLELSLTKEEAVKYIASATAVNETYLSI